MTLWQIVIEFYYFILSYRLSELIIFKYDYFSNKDSNKELDLLNNIPYFKP